MSENIRDGQKRKAKDRLEALLLAGLASEESELSRQDFDGSSTGKRGADGGFND